MSDEVEEQDDDLAWALPEAKPTSKRARTTRAKRLMAEQVKWLTWYERNGWTNEAAECRKNIVKLQSGTWRSEWDVPDKPVLSFVERLLASRAAAAARAKSKSDV